MNRLTTILAASVLAFAAACGGGGTDSDIGQDATDDVADIVETDADDATATDEGRHDVTVDVMSETFVDVEDAIDDTAADVTDASGETQVFLPIVDQPFAQEFNHTGIEVDRRITGIVDIAIKPAWAYVTSDAFRLVPDATFDDLVLLTAGGYWYRGVPADEPEASEYSIQIAVNTDFGAVLGGGFGLSGLYVVQTGAISLYSGNPLAPTVEVQTPTGPFTSVTHAADITLITTADAIYTIDEDGLQKLDAYAGVEFSFTTVTISDDHTTFYVAGQTPDGEAHVDALIKSEQTGSWVASWGIGVPDWTVRALVADVTVPRPLDIVMICDEGIVGFSHEDETAAQDPVFDAGRIPLLGAYDVAKTADGGFVIGTDGGAIRMVDRGDGPEWRFYGIDRWIADENVRAVATTPETADSPIYLGSDAGMTWVTVDRMTIEEKMAILTETIELRHDRDGAVADSRLSVAGDLSTSIPWDSDNDGGWTCYWVIAECLRWKETGDVNAKANFDKSLQAMLNLRLLTGEDWFLARSLIRKDGCRLDDCDNPDDGEWYTSPDGEWWVKSDTSNDEVTSHMFMMGPAYDICADETQKHAIAAHVSNIVSGIIDHGYQLWKPTGECTTYGQFDPTYINFVGLFGDGGRRAAQMLGALNIAIHVTEDQESKLTDAATLDMPGSQKFKDAKAYLMNDENHYDDNVLVSTEPFGRHGSGDGDELSLQAFFPLVLYEQDPALKAMWLEGWAAVNYYVHMQQDAFWDTINGVITDTVPDMYLPERWFRLYPVDLIRWMQYNSSRLDLAPAPQYYLDADPTRKIRSDGRIIPSDERANDRHNTSQFKPDGGHGGNVEMDAADVLAAYWMARYYGFIEPAE